MTADEQATLAAFAAAGDDVDEATDEDVDETLEAVVGLLERQTELLERVAVEATGTPGHAAPDAEAVDHDAPDHVSRGFW